MPRTDDFVPVVLLEGTVDVKTNQLCTKGDSAQEGHLTVPLVTERSTNDEIQEENQSNMAEDSPDDLYQMEITNEDAEQNIEQYQLPRFAPMQPTAFQLDAIEGESFIQAIRKCYEEIVYWKKNLFKVPSGKAGKSFVRELAHMFQAYADASALESVALYAPMVMPALLLQKPHSKLKAKEHTTHSDRR